MRKRLISCLLSLVLICSLLPANVLAEELRDEPIPTAEEVLPETEEPKAPMETEESEAPGRARNAAFCVCGAGQRGGNARRGRA